jgi:hypothetical protein
MCPVCMTTVAVITASATSTGGITAVVVQKLRNANRRKKEKQHGPAEERSAIRPAPDRLG